MDANGTTSTPPAAIDVPDPPPPQKSGFQRGRGYRGNRGYRGAGRHQYQPYPPKNDKRPAQPATTSLAIGQKALTNPGKSVSHMEPDMPIFSVYCCNYGLEELCDCIWNTLVTRDASAFAPITVDYLKYMVCLAYYYRCSRVAVLRSYIPITTSLELLMNAVRGVQFPTVICDYIEALGIVTTPNGYSVGPWVDTPANWFNQIDMISPQEILDRIDLHGEGEWQINPVVIQKWNVACGRAVAKSMTFRPVSFDTAEGSSTMLVSTRGVGNGMVQGSAPLALTMAEGWLGACYRFRVPSESAAWPGDTIMVCVPFFSSSAIRPGVYFGQVILATFTRP